MQYILLGLGWVKLHEASSQAQPYVMRGQNFSAQAQAQVLKCLLNFNDLFLGLFSWQFHRDSLPDGGWYW